VDVREADLASFNGPSANVVVANLTAAVIERYAGRLSGLVEPGGALIVSGFNSSEAGDIGRAVGLAVDRDAAEGEWAACLFRASRALSTRTYK
jgi:ribosomal protein L11 methylase PrmA